MIYESSLQMIPKGKEAIQFVLYILLPLDFHMKSQIGFSHTQTVNQFDQFNRPAIKFKCH